MDAFCPYGQCCFQPNHSIWWLNVLGDFCPPWRVWIEHLEWDSWPQASKQSFVRKPQGAPHPAWERGLRSHCLVSTLPQGVAESQRLPKAADDRSECCNSYNSSHQVISYNLYQFVNCIFIFISFIYNMFMSIWCFGFGMIWARYTCSWRRYVIASCRQTGTMVMLTELVGFTYFRDSSWRVGPSLHASSSSSCWGQKLLRLRLGRAKMAANMLQWWNMRTKKNTKR